MRQYKKVETTETDKVFCNRCGREIPKAADALSVEKRWGYFSEKDNEVHRFDICEACYDAWIAAFSIPVEKQG